MLKEKPSTIKEPYMLTINPNGIQMYVPLTKPPTAELLHSAVGGWIEVVPYFTKLGDRPCIAFCNEEGKINGLRPNYIAQYLWENACPEIDGLDHLVGAIAIIVGPKEFLADM
jgi:hypothetical protein